MHNSNLDLETPRSTKPPRAARQPTGVHWTRTETGQREALRILGTTIAQTAVQSICMSTKDPWGPPISRPQYALAVSLIFTKATNQTIKLGTPPDHVRSTSILWSSLAHDKRFEQGPMNEAAPGDIIIGSGWQQGPGGYAGILVDHGRIVSNSSQGVQDNSSLLEIQRSHPEMAAFRYVGFWNYYRSKNLANAGFNPAEVRIPAGQTGGGQWTAGGTETRAKPEGWFSALKGKLKALAQLLQQYHITSTAAGPGTNGIDPMDNEVARQVAQMSPEEREKFLKGYKEGVKEALPLVAAFVPVVSQIQSVATLKDPKASTVDKVVAAIGLIPDVGGIVKDLGAGGKAIKGTVKAGEEITKAAQEGAQVSKDAEKGAEIAKAAKPKEGIYEFPDKQNPGQN